MNKSFIIISLLTNVLLSQTKSINLFTDNDYKINWQVFENKILSEVNAEKIQEFTMIKKAFYDSKIITEAGINILRFISRNSSPQINLHSISRIKNIKELSDIKNEFEYKKLENNLIATFTEYSQQLKSTPYYLFKTNKMKLREYDFNQSCFYEYADAFLNKKSFRYKFKDYYWGHNDFNRLNYKERYRQLDYALYEINAVKLYMLADQAESFVNNNPNRKVISYIITEPYKFYSNVGKDYISEDEKQQFYALYAVITDLKNNVIGIYKYKN